MTIIPGAEWQALVDALIPGEGAFPAASTVGTHGLVAHRWRSWQGDAEPLAAALAAAGGPLAPLDTGLRVEVVARLERDAPALFATLRGIVYLAYYEQPEVCEAIRGLGFAYNDAPLPTGYALEPFDPAVDAPRHGRGGWVATEAVRRVDLSGLYFLKGDW